MTGDSPTALTVNSLPQPSRGEWWVVLVLAALVTAMVGALAVQRNAVNWKALAALSHAQDVLRQEGRVNLALIGFVEPPLPGLLQIPLAWVAPGLVRTGDAAWVLGALVAGLTIGALNAICASLGVGRPGRWVLCAIALLNPVYLGMASTGSPDALYLLLLLGAAGALLRWQRDRTLRDLIAASLLLSLAALTRYDAVAPIVAATVVVAAQTLAAGRSWARLEGTLITFLLPIVYIVGLWVLANGVILGDPWHFWRIAWQPTGRAGPASTSAWLGVLGAVVVFAPLPAALWWAIWGGAGGRVRLAIGAAAVLLSPALAVVALPGAFALWQEHATQANLPFLPLPELFAPLLAAGWFLSVCALGDIRPLFARKSRTKEVCLAGSAALFAFGCLLAMGPEERTYLDLRPAICGKPFGADDATDTKRVAEKLRLAAPRQLVVAGWPGYAVALYADRVTNKLLLVSTQPPAEPIAGGPASALLVRDGKTLARDASARRQWARALGGPLPARPAWVLDGWAYYPVKRTPPVHSAKPTREGAR